MTTKKSKTTQKKATPAAKEAVKAAVKRPAGDGKGPADSCEARGPGTAVN